MNKKSAIYEKSLKKANEVYGTKSSAYRSAYIVKTYKELGGKIDSNTTNLERWFKEKWRYVGNKNFPVYRPTKRISKKTPLVLVN